METTEYVDFEIARTGEDGERWFQHVRLPRKSGMTIQEVLRHVADEVDGTFAFFEHSCKRGFCGSCLVTANGRKVLSCRTLVPTDAGPMRIEPALKTAKDFWPADD